MKNIITLLLLILLATSTMYSETKELYNNTPYTSKTSTPIFWLIRDTQIENPQVLEKELLDMKQNGFREVYVMIRATRYHLLDNEVKATYKKISALCTKHEIRFIIGLDPRFCSNYIIEQTKEKTGFLLPIVEYSTPVHATPEAGDTTPLGQYKLNEVKVQDGKYSLNYKYPSQRRTHILTEVGLFVTPLKVDKVYAYQRKSGEVLTSSITDITDTHHFFINRVDYEVEVFGSVDLPGDDWHVIAFPHFETNMYAYDSPKHVEQSNKMLEAYKAMDIDIDGIVWDEPGYYVEFGKYTISDYIYSDFEKKYGYSLKDHLYALVLNLDNKAEYIIRNDYFALLSDYVFGGEIDCWDYAEKLWQKPLSLGVHQIWHDQVCDDMFHGSGDRWKGIEAVDAGYVDDGNFQQYFTGDLEIKYKKASFMELGKSWARFSKTQKAHHNQWGGSMDFTDEVPEYWAQAMAAFSNEWINHCYGYTGVVNSAVNFGPGYPHHSTWGIMKKLNKINQDVKNYTSYNLPLSDVALLYPVSTLHAIWPIEGNLIEQKLFRLIGGMSAHGINADILASYFLENAELKKGKLLIKGQEYKSLIVPDNYVITPKTADKLKQLLAANFPVYFGGKLPSYTSKGEKLNIEAQKTFVFDGDVQASLQDLASQKVSTICSTLENAYAHVIPTEDKNRYYITIMPVEPHSTVEGTIRCLGQKVKIAPTQTLAIYELNRGKYKLVYNYK